MTPVGTPVGFAVAIGNPARWTAAPVLVDADAAQGRRLPLVSRLFLSFPIL